MTFTAAELHTLARADLSVRAKAILLGRSLNDVADFLCFDGPEVDVLADLAALEIPLAKASSPAVRKDFKHA